jgi:predicted dehydrogenase
LKRIELHGSSGSAVLEEEDLKAWDFAQPRRGDEAIKAAMAQRHSGGGGAADPAAIGHQAHAKQLADFVAAIRRNKQPAIDGHEGRRSVEIILGVYAAARTGKRVALPLRRDPPRPKS